MTLDPSDPAMQATLHYIFDPLCGWCYAASPLLRAFKASPISEAVALRQHPGLLFEAPRDINPPFRQHIVEADQYIHELTGMPFGEAYIARVKNPAPMVLDSTLPSLAVLAANALEAGAGLDMLAAIQQAHYEAGHDVCKPERIRELAASLNYPTDDFDAMLEAQREALFGQVRIARAMLQAVGAQGFPTFVLEIAQDGGQRRVRLDHSPHYGTPQTFIDQIDHILSQPGETA